MSERVNDNHTGISCPALCGWRSLGALLLHASSQHSCQLHGYCKWVHCWSIAASCCHASDQMNCIKHGMTTTCRGAAHRCIITWPRAHFTCSTSTPQDPALAAASGLTDSGAVNLAINAAGCAAFAALFVVDSRGADVRVAQRKELRERQIAFGDREVFVNESGERMSRLKEVSRWL